LQGIASGTLQHPLNQALLKMEFMKKLFFIVVTLLLSISYANANSYIFIGAGPLTEEAYLVGGAISKTVNNKIRVFRLRASVESTQGDKETLRLLKSGDVELGVVLEDSCFKRPCSRCFQYSQNFRHNSHIRQDS
jgi:hypothetical protein